MGSTFWAELYFRSLKRIKVLPLLTKYLLQHKRVSIPFIGTFELVRQPPHVSIGDKRISAPFFVTRHFKKDEVPEHQVLSFSSGEERERSKQELYSFGEQLQKAVKKNPLQWKGIGTLKYAASEVVFEPEEIRVEGLQALPAEKVLRENVQHSIRVGDQQMTSQQVTDALHHTDQERDWSMLAGWILLILALASLLVFLYIKNFQASSVGLQTGL
jgi:hypothetical protein